MKKLLLLFVLLFSTFTFAQNEPENKPIFSFGGGITHFGESDKWGSAKNGLGLSMTIFNVYVDYAFTSDSQYSNSKLSKYYIDSFNTGYTISVNKGSFLITPTIGLTKINAETTAYNYVLTEKETYMNVGLVFQARLYKTVYPFIGMVTNESFGTFKAGIIYKIEK
jgi:hypothetical protein